MKMVSVSEALSLISKHAQDLPAVKLPLRESLGYFLAEDIHAPISIPPFRQSAMDGYAIRFGTAESYEVVGESKAGDFREFGMEGAEAVRILTGARVPDLADTVVVQENICREGSKIRIQRMPKPFANVRPIGEQVKQGDRIAKKGTKVNAHLLGFLAGFGLEEVLVINKPKITVIVTGNELQTAGSPLRPGGVYECNGIAMEATLAEAGFPVASLGQVEDEQFATTKAIAKALEADVLLISGGISTGDYDFVKTALEANGVAEIFYQVNQKPGRPLWFGRKGKTLVFALPGNPAAMAVCLQVYVMPLLRKISAGGDFSFDLEKGILFGDLDNACGKGRFLCASEESGMLRLLGQQACNTLGGLAQANALVYVEESVSQLGFGDKVQFLRINRW
ncbi:molybdopterin molybdotransferase MoeA [Algoriphagus sp. H41]|uniref:Molybdopterin molybdenumtransferase n=1 Tax=Algoriphagus oliviformis TaxID=2811231 RepID=A0ABS3C8Z5_9BACT|nr:gephyrin-like molybdotransferase Glp [Algoriphagus oliviformis]MBN7813026.1 molybdopterin molybdotransferase MoeA [Algoriphagus oliviformis]